MELDTRQQGIIWTFILAVVCGMDYEITPGGLEISVDLNVSDDVLTLLSLNGEPADRVEARFLLPWEAPV